MEAEILSDGWISEGQVNDRQSFIEFLKILSEEERRADKLGKAGDATDAANSPLGWENGGIADYLEAISAWLSDSSEFESSKSLEWKDLAVIFYVGKIYE